MMNLSWDALSAKTKDAIYVSAFCFLAAQPQFKQIGQQVVNTVAPQSGQWVKQAVNAGVAGVAYFYVKPLLAGEVGVAYGAAGSAVAAAQSVAAKKAFNRRQAMRRAGYRN
jgi:hypothetical protein